MKEEDVMALSGQSYVDKGAAALVKGGVVCDPVTGDVLHDYDWTPIEAAEAVIRAGVWAEVERLREALRGIHSALSGRDVTQRDVDTAYDLAHGVLDA